MKPVISSAVSPLLVNAVRKLAMSTPSTRPSRISREGFARRVALEVGAAHEWIQHIVGE